MLERAGLNVLVRCTSSKSYHITIQVRMFRKSRPQQIVLALANLSLSLFKDFQIDQCNYLEGGTKVSFAPKFLYSNSKMVHVMCKVFFQSSHLFIWIGNVLSYSLFIVASEMWVLCFRKNILFILCQLSNNFLFHCLSSL